MGACLSAGLLTKRGLPLFLGFFFFFFKQANGAHRSFEITCQAAAGAEEDVDLFGSEDDEAEKEKEALRKKIADEHNAKKLAKGKVECPKTIFIFDVKVYELEQNLDQLATKIRSEIVMDGLVWSKDHQLVEVAYGMKKL